MPSSSPTLRLRATRITSSRSAVATLGLAAGLMSAAGCATVATSTGANGGMAAGNMSTEAPNPDPRVGLRAGMTDAAQAVWNLRVLSTTPQPAKFAGFTNSDLAFTGQYAIQGNYNGIQVWDISNPRQPTLKTGYVCPASQNDVSVYRNLLFVSSEGLGARLDCGTTGVRDTVSSARLRGLRIFDISDIANPKYITNVQTCRGSHTHTVVTDPRDTANIYVYISGSAPVRSPSELAGCSRLTPDKDPNSSLFRIEVIKVPLANPAQAAIVSSPRIFTGLVAPPVHGPARTDSIATAQAVAAARASGGYTAVIRGEEQVVPPRLVNMLLDSLVKARNGSGAPMGADSARLRAALPGIIATLTGAPAGNGPRPGPNQCHDITVYPATGLAGGACAGYGLLLDIRNPASPTRLAAVADSNFSYWHSATFNNDATKVLFTDEWGGGGQPKCRATDPREWGADAIFNIVGSDLRFQSYYKLPAPQTSLENCVAHNGSLIPIPGRDVMVQAWYQGGISVFDWTDATRPREIAFFDRGPSDSTRMGPGGSWSAYWYNGVIVSSEIARGLDIFELAPSGFISQNEIDAAKSVVLDRFNPQDQVRYVWPATFALARAYVDQLARSSGLGAARIAAVRGALSGAEQTSGAQRGSVLTLLATQLDGDATASSDAAKVRLLAAAVRGLAQ